MKIILAAMLTKTKDKLVTALGEALPKTALCVTTAANVYPEDKRTWQTEEMDTLRQLGLQLDLFDISGKNTAEIASKLHQHTTLYVTGGNVYYLLEQTQISGFIPAFHAWAQTQGKLYLGCSAGAVLACPRIDYIGDMDDPTVANLTDFSALNLIDKLVMPHIDHPKYGPKAQQLIKVWNKTSHPIVPLNDDQLLIKNRQSETIL